MCIRDRAYTEDTLLSAMERAGAEDMPEDKVNCSAGAREGGLGHAERKGLGTPATRAATLEKLVQMGFVQRKGKQLVPTKDGINLAVVLPESLTSPALTAEWENRLTEIAKGNADADEFMAEIEAQVRQLVKTYSCISADKQNLFQSERVIIGKCPRCGENVYEGKKNFYCGNRGCQFVMWKNDRFFEQRKKAFTPKIAAAPVSYTHLIRHHKMKPYKAVEKAARQLMSANAEYFYQKSLRDNPQIAQSASNPISRMWQKRRIKQQYAKAARQAGQAAAQGAATTAENGFRVTKLAAEGGERVAEFAAQNWKTILIVAVFGLLALLLITGLQSCTVMAGTAGTGVTASSYFSKDKDMLGAEKAYAKLEQKLQRYLDTYEATHNYDEYHFYLDEIEHDPYVLISILSALHDGVFTLAEVQGELEMLFEKQYILTETVTMQIRYRTKMMVIIGPYGVPQVITYQEPYEYYICTVKLKNKDLSHLPVEVLTEEQLSAYSLYMRTLGNRPDLFGQAQYPNASTIKQPTYYDIPPEALKDDKFVAMMEEATKYIGYPYVWGGSSPSTSFDCSGYISWVLNHSGWNVGRQTAQGLYNLCTPVSTAQVKPGDLVFFKGTYDTPGVSHCGIYVGNSIMLHCGDPISYTNLNSKYWQEHFYSYGRLP